MFLSMPCDIGRDDVVKLLVDNNANIKNKTEELLKILENNKKRKGEKIFRFFKK